MRAFLSALLLLLPLSLLTTAMPGQADAAIAPNEVGILAVKDSRESRAVAAYYAKMRSIPIENILALDVAPRANLTREQWNKQVRPQVQKWLAEKDRQKTLRCLVTTWDVPLKIAAEAPGEQTQQLSGYLKSERKRRIEVLNEYFQRLQALGAPAPTKPTLPIPADGSLQDIQAALDQLFTGAQTAVTKMTDNGEREQALKQLQIIYFRSVGLNGMAQSLGRQIEATGSVASPQLRSEFDVTRGRTVGLREGRVAIEGVPFSLEREPQLLALIQMSDGMFGSLAWIDEVQEILQKNETYASFDNELSLVAWPDYQLVRWQPNFLHYRYDESPIRDFKKIFMVSRLEAPTLKRTREIIDQAMQVEKEGLTGKVYLDARGLAKLDDRVPPGGYPDYDQSLLRAADLLKKQGTLEVVLDENQELLQPGTAPDAALYCGWYSLANYVDAFEWKPGAVGYHMASAEAASLRNPESQAWCKRMLEDGAAATLGPTHEPYITAFPRPNEFLPLLMSGRYTLVEAFYRCQPYTSWTMTLIGDPLYNPFAKKPALKMEGLDPATRRILDGPSADFEIPAVGPAGENGEASPGAASEGGNAIEGAPADAIDPAAGPALEPPAP
jgi:uncharacterized protein (TIGR03790 family)